MNWTTHERATLQNLASFAMADFGIREDQFFNRYSRGEVSRARQTFVLVATDNGFQKGKVAEFLKMNPSFITQVRRRNYAHRTTTEYIHLTGVLHQMVGGLNEVK